MSVPLKIFQTHESFETLSEKMKECIQEIKDVNPEFEYYFFNSQQRYDFIKDNFDNDVLNAYISLKPNAYKSDLWRYCVLYVHGGIYLDISFRPVNNFKFINFIDKDYFVRDTPVRVGSNVYFPVYNGLMICKPKNDILLKAINTIVENVKTKNYLDNPWAPTGPVLLGNFFTVEEKQNMRFRRLIINNENVGVGFVDKNELIIKEYIGYRDDRQKLGKNYVELWESRDVYI